QLLLKMQSGVARTLRVVFVSDRRPEQRHYSVACVLIDGALEAMNAFGEDREEAIHDLMPVLGIDLLDQIHRAFHVGEEHRDVLALTFKSASGGENLFS